MVGFGWASCQISLAARSRSDFFGCPGVPSSLGMFCGKKPCLRMNSRNSLTRMLSSCSNDSIAFCAVLVIRGFVCVRRFDRNCVRGSRSWVASGGSLLGSGRSLCGEMRWRDNR